MATTAPGTDRAHTAAKRYIYAWGGGRAEGDATMRDLLGGKGAGLAEMTNAGLPVPPGFTITTEACNDYFASGEQLPAGLWDDVLVAVKEVEQLTGNERFAWDAYRRFISMFGRIVLDIDPKRFDEELETRKRRVGVESDGPTDSLRSEPVE